MSGYQARIEPIPSINMRRCYWLSYLLFSSSAIQGFHSQPKVQHNKVSSKIFSSYDSRNRNAKNANEYNEKQHGEHNDEPQLDPNSITRDKRKAGERRPRYPASAYPLAQEEADFSFNYLSFIDLSLMRTYSQQTRLIEPRRYALQDQFLPENSDKEPSIDDVAMPKSKYGPIATLFAWNGLPARAVVGSASYLIFPYTIAALQQATAGEDPAELSKVVENFLPGISIILGTYFSLTLGILYDRIAKLQQTANAEASVLSMTLELLINIFADEQPEITIEGAQCIADQVRAMVFDSRGRETVRVIYNDPYARILRLLKDHDRDSQHDSYLLSDVHNCVSQLYRLRSDRLTVEMLTLAPTHFDVMTFLCGMLLVAFALATLAMTPDGNPSETARVLFAGLVVSFTIFYEMAFDLNRPFDGIYQIRRSGAAMHFLHIKNTICNHPILRGRVDFEDMEDDAADSTNDDGYKERTAHIWYN